MGSVRRLRGGAEYSHRPSFLLPGRWWLVKIEQSDRVRAPMRTGVCVRAWVSERGNAAVFSPACGKTPLSLSVRADANCAVVTLILLRTTALSCSRLHCNRDATGVCCYHVVVMSRGDMSPIRNLQQRRRWSACLCKCPGSAASVTLVTGRYLVNANTCVGKSSSRSTSVATALKKKGAANRSTREAAASSPCCSITVYFSMLQNQYIDLLHLPVALVEAASVRCKSSSVGSGCTKCPFPVHDGCLVISGGDVPARPPFPWFPLW